MRTNHFSVIFFLAALISGCTEKLINIGNHDWAIEHELHKRDLSKFKSELLLDTLQYAELNIYRSILCECSEPRKKVYETILSDKCFCSPKDRSKEVQFVVLEIIDYDVDTTYYLVTGNKKRVYILSRKELHKRKKDIRQAYRAEKKTLNTIINNNEGNEELIDRTNLRLDELKNDFLTDLRRADVTDLRFVNVLIEYRGTPVTIKTSEGSYRAIKSTQRIDYHKNKKDKMSMSIMDVDLLFVLNKDNKTLHRIINNGYNKIGDRKPIEIVIADALNDSTKIEFNYFITRSNNYIVLPRSTDINDRKIKSN